LLTDVQKKKLRRAEEYEFANKNYREAIALYNELFTNITDKDKQAQMLNHIARNLTKLKKFHRAITFYSRIIDNYPKSRTTSDLPLALIAHLRMIDCYRMLGDSLNAVTYSLRAYRDLLSTRWRMSQDQFMTYSSMIEETISNIVSKYPLDLPDKENYTNEFLQLKNIYKNRIEQLKSMNDLKRECIPEIRRRLIQSEPYMPYPVHHSETIDGRDVLISATMIPDKDKKNSLGILGVKFKNDYIEGDLLENIIESIQFDENTNVVIFNLSGQNVYGSRIPANEFSKITSFFDDNFPPWRIEVSHIDATGTGIIDIRKSFYFWTILTLIIVLSFGVVLIVRSVAHEMEVHKIKSDFVSSVSHEFKTPLASIKALTERLLGGKVKDPVKIKQYITVISQDTDRLTQLVRNILSFSRIEEGKKEYDFERTDITHWLIKTIEDFKRGRIQIGVTIHTHIPDKIPYLKIDKNALTQAINNLLDNAIKFSANQKKIDVIVEKSEHNLIINVKDYGIGIPHAESDKIFEKFYQGKNAVSYSVKGTGLGLTLVQHTVEAHGGKISVDSTVDHGSTFSIFLPITNKTD
jgi:signal transduction histidine kinase